MNVLLLGNGFDLNHKFPTNYIDFLDTVNFLINTDRTKISTIGHVFGNKELQEKNVFIKECYEIHSIVYDSTGLDMDNIEQMISISNTNFWFKYLTKSVDKNIKWIDFEKEIIRVIEAFTNFFENTNF